MPRARRGVVSPADAAAARKRILDEQLGVAKAAKAAKASKGKPARPVVESPVSKEKPTAAAASSTSSSSSTSGAGRVEPPGSPATSSSAPGNKKVELKPVSPPVRPEPKVALEEECKACQGAHRAHTVSQHVLRHARPFTPFPHLEFPLKHGRRYAVRQVSRDAGAAQTAGETHGCGQPV